jgi:hypothetical protein
MANTFKNAWAEDISNSSGSPTTLLTCPSTNSSRCVLIGCHVTNKHASADIKIAVELTDNSASTNAILLLNDVEVAVNSTLDVLDSSKLILEESDIVKVWTDTASSVNVFLSYLLVDTT